MQSVATLGVALISGALLNGEAFFSALAGGLCYLVPSAAAVLFLNLLKPYPEWASYGFVFGESLKIALALMMLLVVFIVYHQKIVFIPFIFGLLAASHLVFLAFLRVRSYGK